MGAIFQLTKTAVAPAPGVTILKAGEASLLLEAAALLQAAEEHADALKAEAETAYASRKEQGYRDGLEQGRLEHAEKLMETVLSSVAFIEGIESTLVGVVNQALRKIIGEMDANERIVRVIRKALNTVRTQQRVTLRLAPADEAAVREALAPMLQRLPGEGGFLDLLLDPRLAPGSCILESDLGVVDASLETQLTAMENAFRSKISTT